MNVVIHTPRVYEEEWQVPSLPPDTADSEVLAIVQGHRQGWQARRVGHRTVDTGLPFVYSRGEADLDAAGRRLADARAQERQAMDAARAAAVQHLDSGTISERQVATALGVDRNTVRAWRAEARAEQPAAAH